MLLGGGGGDAGRGQEAESLLIRQSVDREVVPLVGYESMLRFSLSTISNANQCRCLSERADHFEIYPHRLPPTVNPDDPFGAIRNNWRPQKKLVLARPNLE